MLSSFLKALPFRNSTIFNQLYLEWFVKVKILISVPKEKSGPEAKSYIRVSYESYIIAKIFTSAWTSESYRGHPTQVLVLVHCFELPGGGLRFVVSRDNRLFDPVEDRPLLVLAQPGVALVAVGEPASPALDIIAGKKVGKLGQNGRNASSE